MRLSRTKHGLARIMCQNLFLMCAVGVATAQEPGEAKEVANVAVATHDANEGTMNNVPLVPAEMQKQGMTARGNDRGRIAGEFLSAAGRVLLEGLDREASEYSGACPPRTGGAA